MLSNWPEKNFMQGNFIHKGLFELFQQILRCFLFCFSWCPMERRVWAQNWKHTSEESSDIHFNILSKLQNIFCEYFHQTFFFWLAILKICISHPAERKLHNIAFLLFGGEYNIMSWCVLISGFEINQVKFIGITEGNMFWLAACGAYSECKLDVTIFLVRINYQQQRSIWWIYVLKYIFAVLIIWNLKSIVCFHTHGGNFDFIFIGSHSCIGTSSCIICAKVQHGFHWQVKMQTKRCLYIHKACGFTVTMIWMDNVL